MFQLDPKRSKRFKKKTITGVWGLVKHCQVDVLFRLRLRAMIFQRQRTRVVWLVGGGRVVRGVKLGILV